MTLWWKHFALEPPKNTMWNKINLNGTLGRTLVVWADSQTAILTIRTASPTEPACLFPRGLKKWVKLCINMIWIVLVAHFLIASSSETLQMLHCHVNDDNSVHHMAHKHRHSLWHFWFSGRDNGCIHAISVVWACFAHPHIPYNGMVHIPTHALGKGASICSMTDTIPAIWHGGGSASKQVEKIGGANPSLI